MPLRFDPLRFSIADFLRQLGDVAPERVRIIPPLGTAKIEDLFKPENVHCELVDGTLVEKAESYDAGRFGAWILTLLNLYAHSKKYGYCTGSRARVELLTGLVRAPDISFFSWDSLPNRCPPTGEIPKVVPDIAIEVLSPNKSKAEMERKRGEYFRAGVRLYWEFDPNSASAREYTEFDKFRDLSHDDTLDGRTIVPGFSIVMKELWIEHRATGNS